MEKPFFVMLYNQKGTLLVPLLTEAGDLAMFETVSEAARFARENPMGGAFGFDVFEAGNGVV